MEFSVKNRFLGRKLHSKDLKNDEIEVVGPTCLNALYLDDDVVVLKSFSELMVERMVLGEENYDALANSVILANKDSWFLQKWFLEYRYFNDAVSKSESLAQNYHLFQHFSTFRNLLNPFFHRFGHTTLASFHGACGNYFH